MSEDEVEELVARTLNGTEELLRRGDVAWDVANAAVKKIHSDLTAKFPGHPALARLSAFLECPLKTPL